MEAFYEALIFFEDHPANITSFLFFSLSVSSQDQACLFYQECDLLDLLSATLENIPPAHFKVLYVFQKKKQTKKPSRKQTWKRLIASHEYATDSRLYVQDVAHRHHTAPPTRSSNEEHSCEPIGLALCVQ